MFRDICAHFLLGVLQENIYKLTGETTVWIYNEAHVHVVRESAPIGAGGVQIAYG